MLNFDVQMREAAGPRLSKVLARMRDLSSIHRSVATEAVEETRSHIAEIASYRHRTANRLGAQPTGVLARAANRTTGSHSENGATVTVFGPWFARVFRTVRIVAKRAKALTIPIHALAYGKRVGELAAQGFKFFRKAKSRILWAKTDGGEEIPMYVLATSVTLSRDRSLLPSDLDYRAAARRGIRNALTSVR